MHTECADIYHDRFFMLHYDVMDLDSLMVKLWSVFGHTSGDSLG